MREFRFTETNKSKSDQHKQISLNEWGTLDFKFVPRLKENEWGTLEFKFNFKF